LPEYLSFPLETRELILEFINRVRAANKTKTITGGKVSGLLANFKDIEARADAESLLVGLRKCLAKAKKDGFDFGKRDPTGYVRAVAKSHKAQMEQARLTAGISEERKDLREAKPGGVFQRFGDLTDRG